MGAPTSRATADEATATTTLNHGADRGAGSEEVEDSASTASLSGSLAESAYYGPAGDLVRLIEPHSEADPAALLTNALVALGNMIGAGPHMRVEGDRHPGRLYTVHVGDTSKGRKGSAWGQIRSILELVDEPWAKQRIASGLSSGEGVIYHVRDTSGDEEPIDRRLLVIEPEFASVLRRMEREGNTLSTAVRDAWDSGNLSTLVRHNPLRATGAHVSIIGHVTRAELLRYLTRTEMANGFGNRFLWIPVRRSKVLSRGGQLHRENLSPIVVRLRAAVSAARRIVRVDWGEEAGAAWDEIYEDLSAGKPGMIGEMTSRAEAQVLRLAVLYAILDGSALIEYDHLSAAYAVWDCCEKGARQIFGDRTGDPLADRIVEIVRSHGRISRSTLRDALGRNYRAQRMDDAIVFLVSLDLVAVHQQETSGRPETVYVAL